MPTIAEKTNTNANMSNNLFIIYNPYNIIGTVFLFGYWGV